jgi:hypothetical protein
MFFNVGSSLWSTPFYTSLSPEGKLLYMYLLTNPHANVSGLYVLPGRQIAFETGLSEETIREQMRFLEEAGKVLYDGTVVWVKDVFNWNATRSPKLAVKIEREVSAVPDCQVKAKWQEWYNAWLQERPDCPRCCRENCRIPYQSEKPCESRTGCKHQIPYQGNQEEPVGYRIEPQEQPAGYRIEAQEQEAGYRIGSEACSSGLGGQAVVAERRFRGLEAAADRGPSLPRPSSPTPLLPHPNPPHGSTSATRLSSSLRDDTENYPKASLSGRSGAESGSEGGESVRVVSFQELRRVLQEAKNKSATLLEIAKGLYPGCELTDQIGFVGRFAKQAGGWGRALEILWCLSVKPPNGEVFAYAMGSLKNARSPTRVEQSEYKHEVAQGDFVIYVKPGEGA